MLAAHTTTYQFGAYRLNPMARTLVRDDKVVALPPKAIEVLAELVKQPGEVVGKQQLLQVVWPDTFVEEASLNQMIFLLRRALGNAAGGEYIATVPRRGYRFMACVQAVKLPLRIESIAVLPLANLSGDPGQEYFADGITEALILPSWLKSAACGLYR